MGVCVVGESWGVSLQGGQRANAGAGVGPRGPLNLRPGGGAGNGPTLRRRRGRNVRAVTRCGGRGRRVAGIGLTGGWWMVD